MPIKTLHITNSYHQTSGGVSTFYRAMLETANSEGRLMRLVVPDAATFTEEVGEFGRIYHVAAPRSPFFDSRYRLLTPRVYLPPFDGALRRILREERPDLIEICDKYSVNWLAGMLRRGWIRGLARPTLVGMSCERMDDNVSAFISPGEAGKAWSRFYLGALYIPLFDYHIANSEYTANELIEAMNPRHERPVYVRPMGANVEDFSAAHPSEKIRQRLVAQTGGGVNTRLLLYAGRVSREKNIPLLIELIERLSGESGVDYRLIVAGSGPLADWFESESCRRAPGRVCLLGHVADRKALIDLYANCDLFVHPNPREPFGIAPLEAMAAGLPLVAPLSGGVLSYANDTNAWLAEVNAEAFAAAVRSVFANPAVRKDKLARARWMAQRHNWKQAAASFFDLYDELHADFPTTRFAQKTQVVASPGVARENL
jgi:alpha-1,6-mannosyltransferase